jgi:DNA-binding transcriptional MerR regulator
VHPVSQYLSADEIVATLRAEGDQNVTARTVHYYAEQKLLPPPEYDGTRPRYTVVHLDAMREVRRRKRGGQRLREIAPLLETASAGLQRPAPRSGQRTIAVAPGLTLAADGWSDEALALLVRAIQDVVAARGLSREGDL